MFVVYGLAGLRNVVDQRIEPAATLGNYGICTSLCTTFGNTSRKENHPWGRCHHPPTASQQGKSGSKSMTQQQNENKSNFLCNCVCRVIVMRNNATVRSLPIGKRTTENDIENETQRRKRGEKKLQRRVLTPEVIAKSMGRMDR